MMSDLDTNLLNFIKSLEHSLNSMVYGKVDKAISMFKRERNLLYITRESDAISAVIKSQSHPYELEYAIKLNSDGSFFCGTQNLRPCGGLRGQICKHIILALIAVIKSKEATPNELIEWVKKSEQKRPEFIKQSATEIFLKYKMALEGKIEWRPVEIMPEDFMAF